MRRHTAQTNQQPIPTKELEKICLKAAQAGAKKALSYFNKPFSITYKGADRNGATIVTEADPAVEKEITKIILEKYSTHTIVGEEHGGTEGEGYCWFIDPIDGTNNFSRGFETWSVMVGVALDSKPVAGAIVFPVLKKTLHASKGNGAFKNGKSIHTSERTLEEAAVFSMMPIGANKKKALETLEKFSATAGGIQISGCGSYNAAMLAEGKADLDVIFNLPPWEFCAPAIIITEAGGVAKNAHAGDWTTKDRDFTAAANQRLYSQAYAVLKG